MILKSVTQNLSSEISAAVRNEKAHKRGFCRAWPSLAHLIETVLKNF